MRWVGVWLGVAVLAGCGEVHHLEGHEVAVAPSERSLARVGARIDRHAMNEALAAPLSWQVTGWSPNGRWLALGGRQLHLVSTQGVVHELEVSVAGVTAIAFSPAGDRIAAVTEDDELQVWRMPADAHDARRVLSWQPTTRETSFGGLPCLRFSPDGERLASCRGEVFEVATGRMVSALTYSNATRLVWSRDGRYLVSNGMTADLFEVATARKILSDRGSCWGTQVSPGGVWASTSRDGHEVFVWPLGKEQMGPVDSSDGCHEHVIGSFLDDGRTMVVSGGARYRAFEVGTWRLTGYYEGPEPILNGPSESIEAIADDGKLVAVRRIDQSVFVWDAANLRKVHEQPLATGRHIADFAPNGRVLATHGDGVVELLAVHSAEPLLSVVVN